MLDKKSQAIRLSSVRDVAHENRFYEVSFPDGANIEFEGLMEKMDSIGAEIIHRVLKEDQLRLSPKDMVWFSYFVACQISRTPMIRNDATNLIRMIIHKWGPDVYFEGGKKPVGEYGPEDAKLSSLACIKDVPNLAKRLQTKVWVLSKAPKGLPFIIGDNPVTRHNMFDYWPRGSLGVDNRGIELYMPLSPSLSLHILCPWLAEKVCRNPLLSLPYTQAINHGVPILLEPQNVEFANSLQVIWAERFVFGAHQTDLDVPLDMLRTNPELIDGPGCRPPIEGGLQQVSPGPRN